MDNADSVIGSDCCARHIAPPCPTLLDRGYTRRQEYQGDDYGVDLMKKAGYNPEAALKSSHGMTKLTGEQKYLSTHPATPNRVARIADKLGIKRADGEEMIGQPIRWYISIWRDSYKEIETATLPSPRQVGQGHLWVWPGDPYLKEKHIFPNPQLPICVKIIWFWKAACAIGHYLSRDVLAIIV